MQVNTISAGSVTISANGYVEVARAVLLSERNQPDQEVYVTTRYAPGDDISLLAVSTQAIITAAWTGDVLAAWRKANPLPDDASAG